MENIFLDYSQSKNNEFDKMIGKIEISGRAEVELLVNEFYDLVNQDPLISPIFNDQAQVNWQKHLPIMYDFWETLLFGKSAYKGFPFPKHATLSLQAGHFERWLQLFNQTIDTFFTGIIAEEAKNKALNIATVFQVRLGLQPATIRVAAK
jgi:hemoglobin